MPSNISTCACIYTDIIDRMTLIKILKITSLQCVVKSYRLWEKRMVIHKSCEFTSEIFYSVTHMSFLQKLISFESIKKK